MTIRQAIKKTRDLHQLVLDGKYNNYAVAKLMENNGKCYLCQACRIITRKHNHYCGVCPWITIEGERCDHRPNGESFDNSPQSVKRYNRWLLDPRIPADVDIVYCIGERR